MFLNQAQDQTEKQQERFRVTMNCDQLLVMQHTQNLDKKPNNSISAENQSIGFENTKINQLYMRDTNKQQETWKRVLPAKTKDEKKILQEDIREY